MLFALSTLLALIALVPLWRSAAVGGKAMTVALSVLVVAGLATTPLWLRERPKAAAHRALEVHEAGYVGSQACRSCHPGEHASWHASYHRTMTQVASRETVTCDFERLELDWFGKSVVLEWRGDQLWTVFDRGGNRARHVERPIEQLTGSHNLQVFWYSTGQGRELGPVPMCFKIEEGIWIPLTSVFVLPPQFREPPNPGAWNKSCSQCHTTDARPRVDIGRADTHVSEFGISCEACHGPGEAHVAVNKNPVRRLLQRASGTDDTIINPQALQPVRSAQVCGHCHSVSILRQHHFERWREHGSPFEPGDDLQSSHLVIGIEDRNAPELRRELRNNPNFFRSSFWPDGEVRLSGREFSGLRKSPCYTHGDPARQIDCTSCHRMHADDGRAEPEWLAGQMQAGMRSNAACTQCHEDLATPAGLQAHTHHAPESAGSSCYNCHMSYTSVGLMKASRSHAITSPDVAAELRTGRPNACNQCHLDRTLQWSADHLAASWNISRPDLDTEQREVAASVRWLLSGDAGQRMLAAWSFGWQPAQQASGVDWLAPYLARLLDDPYYVVRFNAARSLRSLGGYGGALVDYDFLAEAPAQKSFVDGVTAQWRAAYSGRPRPAVLMQQPGLERARFAQLYARRDDRPVYIAE